MKNYTKDLFIHKISEIQFPNYSYFENVNDAYQDLLNKFMNVIDKIAPLRQIRVKSNSKPGLMVKFRKKYG